MLVGELDWLEGTTWGGKEGLISWVPDTITSTKMYDGLSEGVA